jgi:hypothetical protein
MAQRDYTAKEAIKEIKKILPWGVKFYIAIEYDTFYLRRFRWLVKIRLVGKSRVAYRAEGATLRACVAKLKKEHNSCQK